YAGDSPGTIDRTSPAARVNGKISAKVSGLDPGIRPYFEVTPDGGPGVMTAERRVPLEGSFNFRDLGGYRTTDGRRVKWGRVFRSDHLARLTEQDQVLLGNMGLRLVCDFRTPAETEKAPDRLPQDSSIEYLHLPVIHGEFDPAVAMARMKQGDIGWLTHDFMLKRYKKKVDDFPDIWGTVLNRLADPGNRPLVFHCTAGKDRAGACAALILLALGVPEETVIYDHGLSNVYIADVLEKVYKYIRAMGVDPEAVHPYFTAPRDAIEAFLNHIREVYGGADNYFRTKAGVSGEALDRLRQDLLE
ncbi:MAG: tyrosine-protein phosphatase, partial [Thermodesulfobacteriota bacterium]|nr:tyrosine-protein phosphatase [Thermodesulfobacteriota bacterium]